MKRVEIPRLCGVLLCACGLAMMLYGIYRGEVAVVLKKAVNICLECIGIG